jgi:hypothetical protein
MFVPIVCADHFHTPSSLPAAKLRVLRGAAAPAGAGAALQRRQRATMVFRGAAQGALRWCGAAHAARAPALVRGVSSRRGAGVASCSGASDGASSPPPWLRSPPPLLSPPTLLLPRRAALHTARTARAADAPLAPQQPGSGAADAKVPPWGLGFSAAGLLFPYYVGVAETLRKEGVLTGARARSLCACQRAASAQTLTLVQQRVWARARHDAARGRIRRLAHRRLAGQRALHT